MQRREFIAAVGTVAAVAAASAQPAFAEMGADTMMHAPKFKALQEAAGKCVSTGNDCMRHCLGMFAMKDTSMTECADSTFQLIAACGALQTLAAVNSEHTGHFAKVVEMICADCQKECEKFPKIAECKACGDACKACAEECRKYS
ncbi:four-helix bundle copper-binding protein [Methylocapsa aurea]|uniref:four-helix bundle copper-binding protein n=1 Tax=Methylocapsa aurea TaxID=663610 RepID=UPI00056877CB|nr:four-helix bundle copper-binding protein [Methylocapsa aurea]